MKHGPGTGAGVPGGGGGAGGAPPFPPEGFRPPRRPRGPHPVARRRPHPGPQPHSDDGFLLDPNAFRSRVTSPSRFSFQFPSWGGSIWGRILPIRCRKVGPAAAKSTGLPAHCLQPGPPPQRAPSVVPLLPRPHLSIDPREAFTPPESCQGGSSSCPKVWPKTNGVMFSCTFPLGKLWGPTTMGSHWALVVHTSPVSCQGSD